MAITSSAKKAIRASSKKRIFNVRRKSDLYDANKAFTKALAAKDAKSAEKLLPTLYASIDKAAKRGVIKGNTADRKKARAASALKRAVQK